MARGEIFEEVITLFRRYVRQETLEPLRLLGRYLLFGIAGSILVGTGTVLLAIGVLRGLQTWGGLGGWWSWVPYLAATVPLCLVAVRAASLMLKSEQSLG